MQDSQTAGCKWVVLPRREIVTRMEERYCLVGLHKPIKKLKF